MKREKLVIVGGGGFAKCIINYIMNSNCYEIIGYVDVHNQGKILNIDYVGNDSVLKTLMSQDVKYSVIGVGIHLNNSSLKRRLTKMVLDIGFKIPTIKGKNCVIHEGTTIGEGVIIRDGAIIQSGSVLQNYCMIGDNSIIMHDSLIGEYSHVVAGSIVGRNCNVGKGCFIGYNSTVLNEISISDGVLIGAKSLVNRNCIVEGGKYFGIPAKIIKYGN
jgi:UDP-N-acetylbacillosamine N-acetyltransferase